MMLEHSDCFGAGQDYVLQIDGGPIGGGKQCISGFMGIDVCLILCLLLINLCA